MQRARYIGTKAGAGGYEVCRYVCRIWWDGWVEEGIIVIVIHM
jgi:hypothetical protein